MRKQFDSEILLKPNISSNVLKWGKWILPPLQYLSRFLDNYRYVQICEHVDVYKKRNDGGASGTRLMPVNWGEQCNFIEAFLSNKLQLHKELYTYHAFSQFTFPMFRAEVFIHSFPPYWFQLSFTFENSRNFKLCSSPPNEVAQNVFSLL